MTVLVLGATGATGRLAVKQLLAKGQRVRVLVRSKERMAQWLSKLSHLEIIETEIVQLDDEQWQEYLTGVSSVVSCLGHNLTMKGLYGHPRQLVSETLVRVHKALQTMQPEQPVKYVLMNTTGVRNPELNEQHSLGEKIVLGLLRQLLPPHADNERAAEYLRVQVGQGDPYMSWVIVRPDNLIDNPEVTTYLEEPSPTRSPIFAAGQTSRMNVGHFMMRLIVDDAAWQKWKGKSPVLYNAI